MCIPVGPSGVEQARVFTQSVISSQRVQNSGCPPDTRRRPQGGVYMRKGTPLKWGNDSGKQTQTMKAVVTAVFKARKEAERGKPYRGHV